MAPVTRKSNATSKAPSSAASNMRNRCRRSRRNATRSSVPPASVDASVPSESVLASTDPNVEPTPTSAPVSNSNNANTAVDFLNAAEVSGFISNSNVVVGDSDERIRNLDSNTTRYSLAKKNAFKKFFDALSQHPSLFQLSEVIDDPECGEGETEYRLIILCRGVKTKAKYNILNSALLVTASNVKKLTHTHVDLAKR